MPDSVPPNERSTVAIREDSKGRILLTGLQQVTINSMDDLINALNFGSSIRQTDSTAINSKSSRSHAVFSLNLVQKKNKAPAGSSDTKRFSTSAEAMNGTENWVTTDSKLHFVDLAGSERLKNSGLTGERVKEGISINAGLASLGKVISQLSTRASHAHVSYRDSRLTRLLQDSLGGNAITYMVACINPVEFHLSETLNTVQYAQRARAIQSKPQIQQRAEEGDKQLIIDRLRSEISFLRDQIRHGERAERRSTPPEQRGSRNADRENELHNQLLDVQENYSALSQRHAKLISEIARSKGDDTELMPNLKGALGGGSLDRLNRSNTFAEAVEQVVLEYEKTIQSLESSLSNARSSLSTSESSLLEREARLVYLEAVNQQLQTRMTKSMEREADGESYVRDLESKLEGVASGEEKHVVFTQNLKNELQRIRESQTNAEEYISTLEERLSEAEQDTNIMQREISRLEHIVERQRNVGKMDGLMSELNNLKQAEVNKSDHSDRDVDPGQTQSDVFHDRLVGTADAAYGNGESLSRTAEEEWKSFGPMEGDEETATDVSEQDHKEQVKHLDLYEKEKLQNQAETRALCDKLDTVTSELFDVRVDHENTTAELDDLTRRYQMALNTLAELQDAVEEAGLQRSISFLGKELLSETSEDGQPSHSRALPSSDLSSHGASATLVGSTDDGPADNAERPSTAPAAPSRKEETLAEHIRGLKRANAEKDIDMAELRENYAQLQDQHKDALNYIEELKEEKDTAKALPTQTRQSLTAGPPLRRSLSQSNLSKDREDRIFATLKEIGGENLQGKQAHQFETGIAAAISESKLRFERVQELEAELTAVKTEMDVKNTMIQGLTRERSAMASPVVDMSTISNMREHIKESQKQITSLHENGATSQNALVSEIMALKTQLGTTATRTDNDHVPGEFPAETPLEKSEDTATSGTQEGGLADGDKTQILSLQKQIAEWETKHQANLELTRASEQDLLSTISGLEASLAHMGALHDEQKVVAAPKSPDSAVDYEAEKSRHLEQTHALQREIDAYKASADAHASKFQVLENSYDQIMRDFEADQKSRKFTESELDTHREMVGRLEQQIEEQKSLASFHQTGLKSLQESHAKELDELKSALTAQQAQADAKLTEQLSNHEHNMSGLREELTKAHVELSQLMHGVSVALDSEEGDSTQLQDRLKVFAEERKQLSLKHNQALTNAQGEVGNAKKLTTDLEAKVQELTSINEQTLQELERVSVKEKKSAQMVQDLEDQLHSIYDQNKNEQSRLSTMNKEKDDQIKHEKNNSALLKVIPQPQRNRRFPQKYPNTSQNQLEEMKRMTASSIGHHSIRDSTDPTSGGAQDHQHQLAKSTSYQSLTSQTSPPNAPLPSPPPVTPLPPVPGSVDASTDAPPRSPKPGGSFTSATPRSPTMSSTTHNSTASAATITTGTAPSTAPTITTITRPDPALQAQLDDAEARLKVVDKHLYSEKQLTQTLEEALVDLEAQTNKTKAEADAWKKKCRDLEEETTGLRREKGSMRNSIQAVEEERDRRIKAEEARRQLQERMEQLNGKGGKGKKKGGLNCF